MGSHSNHTQVVRSSAMLFSCIVCLPGVGALTHAKKLDATLNETCRMITGCLKPTNTNSLPVLAGFAPSYIRGVVASRTERTRQTTDQRHPLNGHIGDHQHDGDMEIWRERFEPLVASVHLNISADEHLPAGAENPWNTWKALNRLRIHTVAGRE